MGELLLDSELDSHSAAIPRHQCSRLDACRLRLPKLSILPTLSPATPRSRPSVWPYDRVLMDTVLPDYDGLKVAKQIRSMRAASSSEVPIGGITARGAKKDDLAYVLAGINTRAAKPIQGRALHAALVPFLAVKDEAAPVTKAS